MMETSIKKKEEITIEQTWKKNMLQNMVFDCISVLSLRIPIFMLKKRFYMFLAIKMGFGIVLFRNRYLFISFVSAPSLVGRNIYCIVYFDCVVIRIFIFGIISQVMTNKWTNK